MLPEQLFVLLLVGDLEVLLEARLVKVSLVATIEKVSVIFAF